MQPRNLIALGMLFMVVWGGSVVLLPVSNPLKSFGLFSRRATRPTATGLETSKSALGRIGSSSLQTARCA